MTKVHHTDDVVYSVAVNTHPVVVGEDDDRTDEELVGSVEERTETADDLDFPGWEVFVSDPPDAETLRYVNTKYRIRVLAPYGTNPFEAVAERLDVDGWDESNIDMSHWGAEHPDDVDGEIHLDLTGE